MVISNKVPNAIWHVCETLLPLSMDGWKVSELEFYGEDYTQKDVVTFKLCRDRSPADVVMAEQPVKDLERKAATTVAELNGREPEPDDPAEDRGDEDAGAAEPQKIAGDGDVVIMP